MGCAEKYVNLRMGRLRQADLERQPNKWIAQMPECAQANRVLDIACGLGFDSLAWAKWGKRVVGIDLNLALLQNAAQLAARQGVRIDFLVADATLLPFRDASFDIAFSEALLEHVPNWQSIVREANRVLGENGIFFVRTLNKHCPLNPEINHLHFYPWLPEFIKRPILGWIMRHRRAWVNYTNFPAINWFTHRGLARFLEGLGFCTYEVIDLARRESMGAKKRRFFFLVRLLKKLRLLRYLVYPFMRMVELLAVKKSAGKVAHAGASELGGK